MSGEPVDEEPEEIEAEEIEPDDEDLMDWIVPDPEAETVDESVEPDEE